MPEPEDVNAAVGRNVRGHRTRMAWTMDDLAARSGVSKGMLSQVEQGRTNPSVATICRLATALGVSIARFSGEIGSYTSKLNDQLGNIQDLTKSLGVTTADLHKALSPSALTGAIGAVLLVDTNRLEDSFSPLDYFESKGVPFIVAVNRFDGTKRYELDEVASALALPDGIPMIEVDARDRESAKQALIRVTEYALRRLTQSVSAKGY